MRRLGWRLLRFGGWQGPFHELELSDEVDAADATEGCGGDLSDVVLPDDPGIDSLVSFGGRLAEPDGSDVVDLVDGVGFGSELEWTADGRLAVLDADGVALLEFDGSTEAEVRSLGIAEGGTPSIDPLGARVAFCETSTSGLVRSRDVRRQPPRRTTTSCERSRAPRRASPA